MTDIERYKLIYDTSPATWTLIERMMDSLYPSFFDDPGGAAKAKWWESLKRWSCPQTFSHPTLAFIARSEYSSQMNLGFGVAGWHPYYQRPHLIAVAVVHDERRRGIATSLVHALFAKSAWETMDAIAYHPRDFQCYEFAGLVKKIGGKSVVSSAYQWSFEISNPFMAQKILIAE